MVIPTILSCVLVGKHDSLLGAIDLTMLYNGRVKKLLFLIAHPLTIIYIVILLTLQYKYEINMTNSIPI